MTDAEFLRGVAEIVACDEGSLTFDTPLASLEEWDSVAYIRTMVFLDENMDVTVPPNVLLSVKTVSGILSAARALQA